MQFERAMKSRGRGQRVDVALMEKGGWFFAQRSANSLVSAELTDDGECAVYYDTPVTFSEHP